MWTARQLLLRFQPPLHAPQLFGHLAATAVPGVEEWRGGAYRRTVAFPSGVGIVAVRPPVDGVVPARLLLASSDDEVPATQVVRRLLDLDHDPAGADAHLADDELLRPLVEAVPGRRVPGSPDAAELLVRAVLGQQVSTAAARTHAGRLAREHGVVVADPEGGLTRAFPTPAALADIDPASLALPVARRDALVGVVGALASGAVALDGDLERVRAQLLALRGVGPWTVETVVMRAFADADAWLPTDLGVRLAAERLGLPTSPGALTRHAERWRPWRAYAVQHLWGVGEHAINTLPVEA